VRLQINTTLALYSVLEFAADPERHIPAAQIATKYGVSPHHLAKVLAELARAGIVESVRGVGGGYRFSSNARRMTLMDVIQLFEDFDPPGSHRLDVDAGAAATPVDRALDAVLSEIDEVIKATFSSITLATMLQLVGKQQS
jgi:Rrf2 family protein